MDFKIGEGHGDGAKELLAMYEEGTITGYEMLNQLKDYFQKEKKPKNREEWYNSPKFIILRFLNNIAAGIGYKAQELGDVVELLLARDPQLTVLDRFHVVERQLRVVSLEAKRLWDECRSLSALLEPKFCDFTGTTIDSENTKQPLPQAQRQD